jgi:hypothetical protein
MVAAVESRFDPVIEADVKRGGVPLWVTPACDGVHIVGAGYL